MTIILANQFGLSAPNLIAQIIIFLIVYFILKNKAFGPILAMLEQRKQRIAEGEKKLAEIDASLASANATAQSKIDEANATAVRIMKEADESAKQFKERKEQEAAHDASQHVAKAREAAQLETDKARSELRREFGRMVADATSRVTGKVLNSDDQSRINQETAAQVSL